jgi:hypothetical protein
MVFLRLIQLQHLALLANIMDAPQCRDHALRIQLLTNLNAVIQTIATPSHHLALSHVILAITGTLARLTDVLHVL